MLHHIGEAILPGNIRHKLKKYLLKAGYLRVPYETYGLAFLISIALNFVIYFFFLFKFLNASIVGLIIGTVASFVIVELLFYLAGLLFFYVIYEVRIFRRSTKIENVLSDFLGEVSVNLRSGMTFDKALWNSVEPEFGILEKEIELVAKKVMSGQDTEEALIEFASKYDSPLLQESMDLIIVGIRSGGEVADLIDRVVENVKTASYLRKELVANVMSYVIFITMISVLLAPTLFALSFNLMMIVQSLGEKLASTGSSTMLSFDFGAKVIKHEDFITFSKLSIGVIAMASSMIIADLREGSIKGGVKYFFFFLVGSLIVYQVMLGVLSGVFGSIL